MSPAMERLGAIARRVSNWGRWGADDERGTMNFVTPDVVKRAADEYNKIAAEVKKAGLQAFLHNEGFENSRLEDGRLTYPVLMESLDPDLVKMQFQMSSMLIIGDPIMYFTNHPGRFRQSLRWNGFFIDHAAPPDT